MQPTVEYVRYQGTPLFDIVARELQRRSRFQEQFGTGMVVLRYDTERFPFRDQVRQRLAANFNIRRELPFERLHERVAADDRTLDATGDNRVAAAFHQPNGEFTRVYHRFLKEFLGDEVFQAPLLFQRHPTVRFCFANTLGYTWRPNYHSDVLLGHPPQEINIWLPLSSCWGSNSLIIAPLSDSLDLLESYGWNLDRYGDELQSNEALQGRCAAIAKPIAMDYGEVLLFDSRCIHLAPKNETDTTRVSLDFRVVPVADFTALPVVYRGTGRTKSVFERGGYYDQRTTAEL